jgi:cell wall-associated NlpC family hydrolase
MSLAYVSIAALDVRHKPEHRAELASQLLLGELVQASGHSADEWRRVRSEEDGYEGWVRGWGLKEASLAGARSWRNDGVRVRTLFTDLRKGEAKGPRIAPLFWNSRVLPLQNRGTHTKVRVPSGAEGWVRTSSLRSEGEHVPLVRRARSLIKAPYLWGGRTPAGLDCSSLTQLMLLERGFRAPRDARDQQRWATPVSGPLRAGDLLFFGRTREAGHVGIALNPRTFIHCRGEVREGSLDELSPVFDRELAPQYLGAGRPLAG